LELSDAHAVSNRPVSKYVAVNTARSPRGTCGARWTRNPARRS